TTGKTMQFVPKDNLYLYFRYDAKQTVMVITNTGDKAVKPDWKPFNERINGFTKARNVITSKSQPLDGLEINAGESLVLELTR
ncbi:MAG TPA: cyclomaltodextrinase C-terminal domain-containing protein, partial [Chitinophagaceae bacterium]|nr:cyclomaltodextrinase C-terminal domain-containing protein [Chitinophagaceae bacterium]